MTLPWIPWLLPPRWLSDPGIAGSRRNQSRTSSGIRVLRYHVPRGQVKISNPLHNPTSSGEVCIDLAPSFLFWALGQGCRTLRRVGHRHVPGVGLPLQRIGRRTQIISHRYGSGASTNGKLTKSSEPQPPRGSTPRGGCESARESEGVRKPCQIRPFTTRVDIGFLRLSLGR